MREHPYERKCKALSLLVAFLLILTVLSLQSGPASAQSGGVGVTNDGPSYVSLSIEEDMDLIFVHVAIRDLNGWDDVYLVNLTVVDNQDRPIAQVIYRQYSEPTAATPVIQWEELVGEHLNREQSSWAAVPIYPWNPENTPKEIGLNVSFAFNQFPGDRISVITLDKGLFSCEHIGPFSAEFTAPPIIGNYVIPIGLSFIIAVLASSVMTLRRHYSNKLAKAVESKEAEASSED